MDKKAQKTSNKKYVASNKKHVASVIAAAKQSH